MPRSKVSSSTSVSISLSLLMTLFLSLVLAMSHGICKTIIENPQTRQELGLPPEKEHHEDRRKEKEGIDFGSLGKVQRIEDEKEKRLHIQRERNLMKEKREIEKIQESSIEKVWLRYNTKLEDVSTQKQHILPKSILVKIHTRPDEFNYYYIVDKSGKTRYRIHYSQLTEIKEVTQLNELPLQHKEYPSQNKPPSLLTSYSISNSVNLQYERNQWDQMGKSLNESGLGGTSFILKNVAYFKGQLPWEIGGDLSYLQGQGRSSTGPFQYDWKAIYLGPFFRSPPVNISLFFLKVHLGFLKSIKHTLVQSDLSSSHSFALDSKALQIGGDLSLDSLSTGWIMSCIYRWEWTSLKNGPSGLSTESRSNSPPDSSFGISIGYAWGGGNT